MQVGGIRVVSGNKVQDARKGTTANAPAEHVVALEQMRCSGVLWRVQYSCACLVWGSIRDGREEMHENFHDDSGSCLGLPAILAGHMCHGGDQYHLHF